MIARKRTIRATVCLALMACCLGGCARWNWPKPPVPDVKPIREQRADQAIREFETRRNEAMYGAALSAWRQGDHAKSRELLTILASRAPTYRAAQVTLVEQLLNDDETAEAVVQAKAAVERFPKDPQLVQLLGIAYATAGDESAANECIERSAELETKVTGEPGQTPRPIAQPADSGKIAPLKNAHAVQLDAQLLMAEICIGLGQVSEAVTRLERLLKNYPEDSETHHTLARALEAAGRSTEAIAYFERAAELAPENHAYTLSYDEAASNEPARLSPVVRMAKPVERNKPKGLAKSQASGSTAQLASAVSDLKPAKDVVIKKTRLKAAASGQSADDLVRQGTAALTAGATASAANYFEQAIQAASDNEELAVTMAVTALRHEQPELAVQLATRALEQHPKSAALYRVIGTAQYQLEHFKAAQVALEQALSLDNSHALSYFLMGCTLSKLGQTEAADWHYGQAKQLDARYARP